MLLVDPLLPAAELGLLAHRVETRQASFIRRQSVVSFAERAVFAQGQPPSYGPSYPPKW
jgi:hypothetical protein